MYQSIKKEWFSNIRADFLSGIVVALALIPEAIAFSVIAGVDPKVGLYASFCIAVIISFVGGRQGMISAATGAMALLMVDLVKDYGLQYLLAATILTGVLQIILSYLRIDKLMSFVARSVVVGFVNALAILIFLAQLSELTSVSWHVYILVICGLGIIYLFPYLPKFGKVLPSPLVNIIILTIFVYLINLDVKTVGDMGVLPDTLPIFLLPNIPLNLETLQIILPYCISLSIVGLLESFMTTTIVDELTDTKGDKKVEARGQGISNIVSGCFGGMAGCAMIGQSIINIKSGGRGRLSTFIAGFLLLIMVVFLSDVISVIPMAALVAIMIMVSIGTFDWSSIKNFKVYPLSSNIVMISTVCVTVYTHNLAYGVLSGVLLASLFFANKISHFMYCKTSYDKHNKKIKTYKFFGQIFFNSSDKFYETFNFKEVLHKIIIDISKAHFWDVSAVYTLDKVIIKFKREGCDVEIIGKNEASKTIIDRFGIHDKVEDINKVIGES